jgi:hypothetical protein
LEECVARLPLRGDQSVQPPNKALELTPRGGEQDRGDFDGWFWLDCIPDLQGGAAQRQIVGRPAVECRSDQSASDRVC